MDAFSIGQLARGAGVAVSTVRFYERKGLLKPEFRTAANYRGYGRAAMERLRFIRFAQKTGFSLKDVRELLSLEGSESPPCDEVVALIRARRGEVRQRLEALRQVEKVLSKALRECCKGKGPDLCDRIGKLSGEKILKSRGLTLH